MNAMLVRTLVWGGIFAAVLLVAGGAVGWLLAGQRGLVSAAIATAVAAVFMGLTAISMLVAGRRGTPSLVALAGAVVGVFLGKMVLFVVLMIWLRTQDWLEPGVFGVTAVIAVVGTLGIDIAVMATSRIPIVETPVRTDDPGDA